MSSVQCVKAFRDENNHFKNHRINKTVKIRKKNNVQSFDFNLGGNAIRFFFFSPGFTESEVPSNAAQLPVCGFLASDQRRRLSVDLHVLHFGLSVNQELYGDLSHVVKEDHN